MTEERPRPRGRLRALAGRLDRSPRLLGGIRAARELLPGDSRFGDALSTAGQEGPHVAGRRISELTADRPGLLRETGLGALQVWQALSEAQGRGRGDEELTILFTDLADFSTWALEAGDTLALDLLRAVGDVVEPAIEDRGGRVVKRLGDGLMAVFVDPQPALDAAIQARAEVGELEVGDHTPRLRAGIHLGRPRKMGGDYLGVDVNVAARLAESASANEILVSDRLLANVALDGLKAKRRWIRIKGAPKDLQAHAIKP